MSIINIDTVVALLDDAGIGSDIEHMGGGCYALSAGPLVVVEDYPERAVFVGPLGFDKCIDTYECYANYSFSDGADAVEIVEGHTAEDVVRIIADKIDAMPQAGR